MNSSTAFFKANFIHVSPHQINPSSMSGLNVFGCRWVWHSVSIESPALISYQDGDLVGFTPATNVEVLPGVAVIAMNNGIHQSLAQCDFNVSFISSQTTAIAYQLHARLYEGRKGTNLTWQRVLKCEGEAV